MDSERIVLDIPMDLAVGEFAGLCRIKAGSHIHFSGDGYQNCSLCKKLDCIGRRAKFDRSEYVRIFGSEPW